MHMTRLGVKQIEWIDPKGKNLSRQHLIGYQGPGINNDAFLSIQICNTLTITIF